MRRWWVSRWKLRPLALAPSSDSQLKLSSNYIEEAAKKKEKAQHTVAFQELRKKRGRKEGNCSSKSSKLVISCRGKRTKQNKVAFLSADTDEIRNAAKPGSGILMGFFVVVCIIKFNVILYNV